MLVGNRSARAVATSFTLARSGTPSCDHAQGVHNDTGPNPDLQNGYHLEMDMKIRPSIISNDSKP
jgi:hypothetical protein